jgi:hypothetical protein
MIASKARWSVLSCAIAWLMVSSCDIEEDSVSGSDDAVEIAAVAFSSTAVAQNSGRCLDVFGAQTGDDVNLIQWNCHGGTNQSFNLAPVSGTTNTYTIGTFSPGKCVGCPPDRRRTTRASSSSGAAARPASSSG